jgi:hypothetical protein
MMTQEQSQIVKLVYTRFIDSEEAIWSEFDDNLEFVDYMTDEELIRECKIKTFEHSKGSLRCVENHDPTYCMAPLVLEAVEAILDLHNQTGELHEKNRYVLTFYIAMSAMGLLYLM